MRIARTHQITDATVGIVMGLLAGSNLVQGAWVSELPWLNLTAASFALALPATLISLHHRISLTSIFAVLTLGAALSLGFIEPALSASASDKRTSLLVTVLPVFVAGLLTLSTRQRLRWFMRTIVVLALIVLVGQTVTPDPGFMLTGRRTPEGLNPIGAGRALAAGLIVSVSRTLDPSTARGARTLAIGLSLALGVGIAAAGSRGPVLGAIAGAALLLWMSPAFRVRVKAFATVVAAIVSTGLWMVFQLTGSRIVQTTDSNRNELYADAIRVANQHPLGIGWGNFFRHAQTTFGGSEPGDNLYAHNIVLEFWIEAGTLGGVLFIILTLIIIGQSAKMASMACGRTLVALTLSLFIGAMLSSDVIGNRMLWVTFAAILGLAGAMHRPSGRQVGQLGRRVASMDRANT